MILAAGRGERLRPVTDTLPKPLLPIGGEPLLFRHLRRLAAAGFSDVVINVSWLGHQIIEAAGDGSRFGLRLQYSDEGAEALETGGGIFRALPLLGDDPFLVINGDILCDVNLGALALQSGRLAHLLLVPNPAHNPNGDFSLAAGEIGLEEPCLTFSGIGVYHPALFAGCRPGRFALAPILREAITAGKVSGELWTGFWSDLGTADRLAQTERLLNSRT